MTQAQRRQLLATQLLNQTGWRCAYCSKPLNRWTMTEDHVWPRALGGSNARSNKLAACKRCNQDKGHQPLGVWTPPNPLPLLQHLPRQALVAHVAPEA